MAWTDFDANLRASNHGQWLDATGQHSGPRLTFSTSPTAGFVYPLKLAVAPDGHFVVAYGTGPVAKNVIQWFEADGQPRTPPRRVNGGGFAPSVAMDADGDTVIAYHTLSPACGIGYLSTPCVQRVHVSRYTPGGVLRVGRTVRTVLYSALGGRRIANGDSVSVAMDPDGDFLVVWRELNYAEGLSEHLMARAYSGRGAYSNGRTFEVAPSPDSSGISHVAVAAGGPGRYLVAWSEAEGSKVRAVHGRTPQGDAVSLTHPAFENSFIAAVAGNASDAFVALVNQYVSDPDPQLSTARLHAVRLDANAVPVGPQSALGVGLDQDVRDGRIALDPQSNATAVWDDILVQHPLETQLLGQRVEP